MYFKIFLFFQGKLPTKSRPNQNSSFQLWNAGLQGLGLCSYMINTGVSSSKGQHFREPFGRQELQPETGFKMFNFTESQPEYSGGLEGEGKKIHLHCMIRPGDWRPWSGWRCALLKCKVNSSSPELDNFKADWLLRLRILLHFSSLRSPLLAAGQSASHKALLPLAHDFMGVLDVSLEHVCSNSKPLVWVKSFDGLNPWINK